MVKRTRRRHLALGLALVLGVVVVATGCEPPPPDPASCVGTGFTAHRNIPYRQVSGVSPSLLSLDVYEPVRDARCGPAPQMVYVHGGGFRRGDKANQINDKVNLVTSQGWVFVSVNYRLSTPPAQGASPVRYPTHEQDVAAAIKWVSDHSATYHGDPRRLLLMGHSSGAFIASLLSTDTSFLAAAGLDPADVRCSASLDTEYDITAEIAQGGTQEALYRNAFGNDPAVWRQGSPIEHTDAGSARPPFLIFTRGTPRRISGSQDFAAQLRASGTPASVVNVSPLSHEDVNDAVGQSGDTKVTPPLMDFFTSCVAPTA